MRSGRLVAVKYVGHGLWKCKCDCGNIHNVSGSEIRKGTTKSCGCLRAEINQTHNGECYERLYHVWKNILYRCNDPTNTTYGARGIKVCDDWKNYSNFKKWAYDNGYNENAKKFECTIDRIDYNGNYEPSNCRWVDMKTQIQNRRIRKDSVKKFLH